MTKLQDKDNKPIFLPDTFYHIYNRGNNKENIFFNDANYNHFLKLFDKYLYDYIDTYTYCLLPNHFHFLIKIKSEPNLNSNVEASEIDVILSEQFRKFFMRYSKAVNKQEKRVGSLFQKNFKRKPVINENHMMLLVSYIHTNSVHHSFTMDFENYKWSSYGSILSDKPTKLKRKQLIELFGGKEEFVEYHKSYCDYSDIRDLIEIE